MDIILSYGHWIYDTIDIGFVDEVLAYYMYLLRFGKQTKIVVLERPNPKPFQDLKDDMM